MKKVLGALVSFPSLVIFGTLILSLVLWFLGPLLGFGDAHPFDSMTVRIIVIAVFWLIAILTIVIVLWRKRARDKALSGDIAEAADESGFQDEVVQGEISEMRDKLRIALGHLRKSKRGRGHLYELPWYVVIGPPGAGKTTAIVNSGLKFPLSDEIGKSAIGGVGGTRNCDWWFTNEAVLIDTAGRYTTQESDESADNSAWTGFLSLLKKHRKRQPINGAIIAISLSDLSMQDTTTQAGHAAAIRRRLQELREQLGVRFPVYILFTKADLIAGFAEYFDGLGKQEREQVWGFTLPLSLQRDDVSPISGFREEFDALLSQLNSQSLERIQTEIDPQRRSLIAGFPNQVASLRQVAGDFLSEVFQDNRFDDRQMLRGVYFTSGTQEGAPIDRLMMGMARTFGIGRQAIGTGQGTGKSYFLTKLLQDVIFKESGLVSADDKVERRYRWIRRGAIAASVVVAIVLGSVWTRSYLGNTQMMSDLDVQITRYKQEATAIPSNPVGDTDLPAIVPALNILRDLPGNPVVNQPEPDQSLKYGLYQGNVIGTQAAQTYRGALNQHLLPRLLLRLEEQVQDSKSNPNLLYEALKTYLILGLQGPMDKEFVKEWMVVDWQLAYPDSSRDQFRSDLADHLNALLDQPMQAIALNGPLVDEVQSILADMPLAERIYNGIITSPAAASVPKWRLTAAGGAAISRVFVRPSGKPLSGGVDGIFTYNGFNDVFLGEALQVAKRLQSESWVMGDYGAAVQNEQALANMSREVLDLYFNDFIGQYEGILGDLDIIPLDSLSKAVEIANVLSGNSSPIVKLLNAVSQEIKLTEDRSETSDPVDTGNAEKIGKNELLRLNRGRNRLLLQEMMKSIQGQGSADNRPPGAYVEYRFSWLIELVAVVDGAPSQLDAITDSIGEVYRELSRMAGNNGILPDADGGGALLRLQQEAGRITEGPLKRWASQIGAGSSGITARGTRAQLNARWQSQVLSFCSQALTDRYPFTPRASADVAIQDFTRLFAPNGMIDTFVNSNLLDFIDSSKKPWAWKTVNGSDLGISNGVLEQLQFASEIRDAFFGAGPIPNVTFEIRPEALSENAKKVLLEIHGEQIPYQHNKAPVPVSITWPGDVGLSRITFSPSLDNMENSFFREGPWAWFRVFNAVPTPKAGGGDQNRIIFKVGTRTGIFKMRLGSAINPFTLPALTRFRCPQSL